MTGPGARTDDTPLLRVQVMGSPSSVWIQLAGEVDISNHGQLRTVLFTPEFQEAQCICVDLRQLTFCDITGCDLLLLFNTESRMYGRQVRFVGPRPGVRKMLDLLPDGDGPDFW